MPHRNDRDLSIDDFMRDRFANWNHVRIHQPPFGYHNLQQMKPGAKEEWATALESGDYDQVTGYLKVAVMPKVDGQRFAYCCWGVLCEIKGVPSDDEPPHPHITQRGIVWDFKFEGLDEEQDGTEIPPDYWVTRYDIQKPVLNCLAEANDHGYNFGEIAGWIRRYL